MSSKALEKWCVYRHTAPNGKLYFGITSYQPKDRWLATGNGYSNQTFGAAVLKYGWNNIAHHILSFDDSGALQWIEYTPELGADSTNVFYEDDAKQLEQALIQKYETYKSTNGYNRTLGGEAELLTEETKKSISESHIRKWSDDEYRASRSGRNSPFWKDFDKTIFRLLDEQPNRTIEQLAEQAGCCVNTAIHFRKEWLAVHPDVTITVDRTGDNNPNYREMDKKVFAFLDSHPKATAPQIQEAVGCDNCTALKYRKLWREARGVKPQPSFKDQIFALMDANPEAMLIEIMDATGCSELTASKYRKQWQANHPQTESRRSQDGKHNPNYKGWDKKVFAYLDEHPDASLGEIMEAVGCSDSTARKYRRLWQSPAYVV